MLHANYNRIQYDAAIRFDTVLRISNILDILINSIRKDNPYDDMKALPQLSSDRERLMTGMEKKACFSNHTLKIIKKYDSTEKESQQSRTAKGFKENKVRIEISPVGLIHHIRKINIDFTCFRRILQTLV